MARPMRIRAQGFTRITKPDFVFSIPGISRILDSNVNCCIKLIWILVLLLMTCLCGWQATNCILVYWSNPVVKETYTIRSPLVQFPVIYYCPAVIRLFEYLFYNLAKCDDLRDATCYESNPFLHSWILDFVRMQEQNKTFSDIWKGLSPHRAEIKIYEVCGNTDADKCTEDGIELKIDEDLNSEDISTFWGTCIVLNTAREVTYRGPFTYYKIVLTNSYFGRTMEKLRERLQNATNESESLQNATNESESLQNATNESEKNKIKRALYYPKVGALISFHQSFGVNLQHLLYYLVQDVYQGFETHIKLKTKKFQYKNRTQDPCGTEAEYLDCISNCFELTTSKNCKMPYIRTNKTNECKWELGFKTPLLENHKAYTNFNFSACNCRRACDETVITGSHNVIGRTFNETHLVMKFFFATNVYEKIVEKFNYPFTLCLSDIGGHFGFFLGLCILTGVEIIESSILHALYIINLKKGN